MTRRISIEVISCLLIILFIYTGLNKLMEYSNFKFQLGRSPFIQPMAGLIARTLPFGELLIAVALIFRKTRMAGLYASYGLMLLFTGYIYLMLKFTYDLPCSCGGVLAQLSWSDHLIFNIGFTLLALGGIILQAGMHSKVITENNIHKKIIAPA